MAGEVAFESNQDSTPYYKCSYKTNASVNVLLSSVVGSELLKSNLLQAGDIDVTALTSTLRGYKVTAGATLRNSLELLQGAWPFDLVQKGYKLVAKKRGGASVATVPATDLAAAKAGA